MAAPVAMMSMASMAASAGGSILGASGASRQGEAQAQAYAYQAGVAEMRKKIALQNRDYSLATGETEAQSFGLRARNTMGKIEAAQAASGMDVGSGSTVEVRKGQQKVTDLDMAQIRNNAARKAYGYMVDAETEGAQAEMYRTAESNTRDAIPYNVASSLLSGATSVSSKWLQGNQAGAFSGMGA
jgi:hypothetical protein